MRHPLIAALLASAAALPALAQEDPYMLPEITIQAESNTTLEQQGYVPIASREATRLQTPIAKIPQAISVVTQDQIEDQAPRNLNEALGYSAGANPNNFGFDTRFDAFFLRGFPAYYNGWFRDGLRQLSAPTAWFKSEPYGIEGAAVLKGPASSLYGVSGPGGIVNLITKRPKDEPYHELEFTTGANDRAQIAADISGPLGEGGHLSYRLTSLLRQSNSDLPGYADDKVYVAPALTWDDGVTRLTVLAESTHSLTGGTAAFYNPAHGEVSDLYEGDPDYNDFEQNQWRIGYELEHALTDTLTLRQNFRAAHVDIDLEYSGHDDAGGMLNRYWGHYLEEVDTLVLDSGLRWNVATGAVEHEILAGIDLTRADYDSHSAIGYVSAEDTAAIEPPFAGGQKTRQAGIYLHDQMRFGSWQVFASARYDHVRTTETAWDGSQTRQTDTGRSGRLAVSHEWDNGVMAYGSLSTSFSPNLGMVYDGGPDDPGRAADPTQSTQREIGLKYAPEHSNLLISAALFDIDQRDGVVLDASTRENRQRQLDLNSRGFELEAQANWDNGFSLIAAYAHQRVKIERGRDGGTGADTSGNELSATPNDTLSVWGKYQLQAGRLDGLSLGLGLRLVGESYGDDANTITNEARGYVDMALAYDIPQAPGVQLQLNVKNLLDEQKTTCTAGYCYRDEGRTWTASLRKRF
ncbi:TonB-dependent siderophore receptor [Paracoccus siganidrum]|uniref:TonB-dependent siderophore receptor n=1 Tax=Paracoccus siganidrum TaxID=1276757 RepID=A0A419A3M6_9RHOB|nr:TonB-dependent siderophore receptor [Paracoccus siganidrum]RJL08201.1 TonB-dependent siderophore receptor [Paracoccus siganidrum]RMC34649.1 TonB-dependent siderophore receptor [Paracoccus siganidrum]